MSKAREFSPGRKESRGRAEGRHMIPSVGDSLDFASKKEDELLQLYDHTCLFYIKASLRNLRQAELRRESVKWN